MTRPSRLRSHALMTDEPGVLVHNPRRQLVRLLVLYAVLPLICAAAGAFIAYQLGNERTDQRVDALEADLAQRRASRAAEDRARDERLTQTRRDLCVVLDRLIPRDPPVEDLRRRYGCTGAPPSSSPPPRTPLPSGGRTTGTGSSGGRTTTAGNEDAADPRPAPAPGPPGPSGPTGPAGPPPTTPSPPPADPDGGALVCLPVIGCVL